MPSAVFRCDASAGIGGGHVVRSLVLADALVALGWETLFVCRNGTADTVPALGRGPHGVVEQDGQSVDDPVWVGEAVGGEADLLVVDHYGLDAGFESACRKFAERVLVIDDLANRPHDCDALLDQTFGRKNSDYASLCPKETALLLGSQFALLRPQFRCVRAAALQRRDGIERVSHVFVGFGAVDGHRLAPRALQALADAGFDGGADVVLGPKARSLSEVEALTGSLPFPIRLQVGIEDVATVMANADLAIGAGGTTTWERCCVGLPSLMIVANRNQQMVADGVAETGAARSLGWFEALTQERFAGAVRETLEDTSWLRDAALAAAGLCDGLGAERTVSQLGLH